MTATATAPETTTRTVGYREFARPVEDVELHGERFLRLPDGRIGRECGRCGGLGVKREYGHVYSGECFGCRWTGIGHVFADEKAAEQAARKNARAAVKASAEREAQARIALAQTRERDHAEALREDARRTAQAEKASASRFLGAEGEKVTVTGTVTVTYDLDSQYGTRYLVVVEGSGDDAGVTLKTIGTSEFHYGAERGDVVTVKATVKAHEVYRDVKQTVVIRPKVVTA